uniref:OCA domain-containing protein n=1 Tax=Hippocampus comes TaxID=109280 RepID=A0A3Q2ZEL1_HIPCM
CHWKSRSRPYQGVRVKDSVKELLRRKRSAELLSTKTTAHAPVSTSYWSMHDPYRQIRTIPVGATTCSLPQMDLPDLGCAYLPWTHPLTTLSTVISGVQFASGSTPVSGSSFVHTPLSKSLTNQDIASQHQILEPLQYSDQTNPKLHNETPNLLDKILEDQGKGEDSGGKVSYSNSFYLPSAF